MSTATLEPRTSPISAGETAPDFTLKDQDGNDWTLSKALALGEVVLCFYPMAFSPVCEGEMTCATNDLELFENMGATVVGISGDSWFTQKAWAEKLGLKQTLLADMHREVCKAYGFYFKDLHVPARGTVIVSQDGTVKWVQARELGQAMQVAEVVGEVG